MFLLEKLTLLLPKRLQPYAKAAWPAIISVVAAAVSWVATGNLDLSEIRTAIGGGLLALVTLGVPNRRKSITLTMPAMDAADERAIGKAATSGVIGAGEVSPPGGGPPAA
jgi:hypothetical protein